MKVRRKKFSKLTAIAILLLIISPLFIFTRADAYSGSLLQDRSITMETSEDSATDVIYSVSFDTATTHSIASVVIQYCDSSPIIGDSTCGDTRSFDWDETNLSLNNLVGLSASTIDSANSDSNNLIIDVDTPASISSGTTISFDLGSNSSDGVVNPDTTNSTFYMRILTFTNATNAEGYSPGTDTNATDVGGLALSTANTITITAKVHETLTFCVYTGANCAAGGTTVSLGDANDVLSTSTTYTDDSTQFDLATNAASGAKVYASGNLLESGSNDIDAIGATCTADSTGTEQFGFRITNNGTANTNVDPTSPYDCSSGNHSFVTAALDPTSTTSPFGDEIAETTSATDSEDSAVEFAANISNITAPGVYTTEFDFVAAPTF